MPRPAKLRKKNGYWMTKAGGTEVYFGRIEDVPFREAQKAFAEHLKTLDDRPSRRVVVTCLEICDRHLEWVLKERSKHTYKQRRHFLERWCDFEVGRAGRRSKIGDLPYTQVNKTDLQSWLDALADEHRLGKTTQRAAQTAVKACWNWAATEDAGPLPSDFVPFAGMSKIKVPPNPLTEDSLITEEEVELLLQHADDDLGRIRGENGCYRQRTPDEFRSEENNPYGGFQGILKTYYHTGARTSELAHITKRDVLHQTRQVVLGQHKRAMTTATPTIRRITLNDEAYSILDQNSQGKQPNEPVFVQSNGSPWNKDRLNDRFSKVRKRAGVRSEITIYSFRHLYISELLMAGNDITTVAKMAGTSVKMIEQVYGHFRNEHFEQAQKKLDLARESRKKRES